MSPVTYSRSPSVSVRASLAFLLGLLGNRIRAVAFWLAVCLPWTFLALVAVGYDARYPNLLAAILVGSVLCTAIGQDHLRN
ncbi:hypothetical protein BRC65_05255 [Halobacteriales archaeon QH_2_65_14]|jgi:hypothetical protein|nr:MAG: hypothetical protein BRC65_05255 [Halobacteriales archaeon QH_2_65_14]